MKSRHLNATKICVYLLTTALMLTMCLSPYAVTQAKAAETQIQNIDELTPEEIEQLNKDIDAVELTPEQEEQAEELAKDLKSIDENVSIRDADGDIIGFDEDALEKEYSDNSEYEVIKQQLDNVVLVECNFEDIGEDTNSEGSFSTLAKKENPKWRAASNSCLKSQLTANYGLWSITGFATGVIELVNKKAYKQAALKMVKSAVKLGIKANAASMAINLLYIGGHCGEVASKKYKKWI
ncbi:hypothetical protein [Priestia megaterium]|uniref:hypothetical protein n=1 Tax=Priestia megaterium TaxID=1404 RepID=UPI000D51A266|nr:hypothetical protein [Priestia megaterium]PVE70260.1 hypothetical protein DC428_14055 [Priestia megaterium]PVE82191.1 hypothetical protein DC421_18820 [Priestia megaterium]PVE86777.1 hypothetical protein DC426_15825 [Priestia megaterium]PVE94299.1 hypothetical protein DC433_25355 [Priestia megaterium]